ncbi:hypothetical protein GGF31_008073 [Allomyces arbusculus]|nr:hypothetical protein GGF31_008073 [Allomyces arbusculus]
MAPTVAQIAATSTTQAVVDVVDAMGTSWVARVVGVVKGSGVPMVLVAEIALPGHETGRSMDASDAMRKVDAIAKLMGGNDVWANRAAASSETAAGSSSSISSSQLRKTTKWLDHLVSSLLASSISSDLISILFGTAALRHHPAARAVALDVDTLLLHAQAQSWFPCTTMVHDPYAGVADGLAMVLLADDMVLANQLPPEHVETVIAAWRVVSKCSSLASMFLDDRSDHACFTIPLAGLAAPGTAPGSLVVHTHLDVTLLTVLDASPVNPAVSPNFCARIQKVLQDVASLDLQRVRVAVDKVPAMASRRSAPAWPKSAVTKTMGGGPKRSSTRAKVLGSSGERQAPPTDLTAAAPEEKATARAARGPEMRLTAGLHNALANYTYAPGGSATAEYVSSSTDPAWSQRCQSLAHLPRVSVHSRRFKTWTHRSPDNKSAPTVIVATKMFAQRPHSAALLIAALVALLAATTALAAPVAINEAVYEQITAEETLVLKSTVDTLREPRRSRFDRVIAFGDSSTDSGNVFNLTKGAWPVPESYAQGRFSNGRTWVEYLARHVVSKRAPVLRNFAFGGATTDSKMVQGYTGPNSDIAVPSVMEQLVLFAKDVKRNPHLLEGRNLYAIWAGDAAISPDTLANNLIRAVEAIDDIHAHTDHARTPHILLLGMSDFNYMPYFATLDDASRAKFIAANQAFNAALAKHVQAYRTTMTAMRRRARVTFVPTVHVVSDILANPEGFGFPRGAVAAGCLNDNLAVCKDPDNHIYWDAFHLATKTHSVLGDAVANVVEGGRA